MKNRVLKALAVALALAFMCGAALAEVRTTANVWLRTGPGLGYDTVTSLSEGKSLTYLGESSVDDRGVAWYKVSTGKHTGWVSSRYSELRGETEATPEPTPTPTPKPTAEPTPTPEPAQDEPATLPALNAGQLFSDLLGGGEGEEAAEPEAEAETEAPASSELPAPTVELSLYYMSELVTAANDIGLISYRQVESEAPYQYYNNSVIVAGNQYVENIVVYGGGYEVFGVHVGMTANAAQACLNAAGLDYVASMNGLTYEHRGGEGSVFVDANGHDSCVNLWLDDDNIVTEIDWSTYTG